jgi:hypothetical protein
MPPSVVRRIHPSWPTAMPVAASGEDDLGDRRLALVPTARPAASLHAWLRDSIM